MPAATIVPQKICKPILKWAGGKGQLLSEIQGMFPDSFNKYIEPFIGGGAVFFGTEVMDSIISDTNEELINMYRQVARDVDAVIEALQGYQNTEEFFYKVRSRTWWEIDPVEAAARMIYLNRTCFNGLYRVNKSGHFNVPFGRYSAPKILDENRLRLASEKLKLAKIEVGDYKEILSSSAEPGDLVFLDPPYIPISKYSDFKRYNANQFGEAEQIELAEEVKRLSAIGVSFILTNSNHPTVHELYEDFEISVLKTRRNINSKASARMGEDVLVRGIS